MSSITAVILAAGHGTRMKSNLIKVMHPIAGKPMIGYVVDSTRCAGIDDIVVVVGFQRERIQMYLGERVQYAVQSEQLGTGHALLQAEAFLSNRQDGEVLVLLGDNPFINEDMINRLINHHISAQASATLLTAAVQNPTGLGRVLRDPNTQSCLRVVEEKDAAPEEKLIQEIWTGAAVFQRTGLIELLRRLDNHNAQREYYLPQAIEILLRDGKRVEAALAATEEAAIAPNDRIQLAEAEGRFRRRIAARHMLNGVTIIDPSSTFIDEEVEIGQDTTVWPFTFILGKSTIGAECTIGPASTIVDSHIADNSKIVQSVVEASTVGAACKIGPMAHLRPGCELGEHVEIGNYAELKKAKVSRYVKCHHHSYLGDVTIGEKANIGAGAITANYNGFEKFHTEIAENAFIGTNVNLVAPISVGNGAFVAAGSTIAGRNVPAEAMALERAEQVISEGGASRLRARWQARKDQRK